MISVRRESAAQAANRASIDVADRIQDEDVAICVSVQRGLQSRAYSAGRLSVRREAGEHLFHRLLHADLERGFCSTKVTGRLHSAKCRCRICVSIVCVS